MAKDAANRFDIEEVLAAREILLETDPETDPVALEKQQQQRRDHYQELVLADISSKLGCSLYLLALMAFLVFWILLISGG